MPGISPQKFASSVGIWSNLWTRRLLTKPSIIKIYEAIPISLQQVLMLWISVFLSAGLLERCLRESGGAGSSAVLMDQRTLKSLRSSWGERCGKPSITSLGVTTTQPGAWSFGDLFVRKVRNDIRRASPPFLPSAPAYLVLKPTGPQSHVS